MIRIGVQCLRGIGSLGGDQGGDFLCEEGRGSMCD